MGIFGMMSTGAFGMNAQANRLGTVADNIANASTVGYKSAGVQFTSLLLPSGTAQYNSGSVETVTRYAITQQGPLTGTTSVTDIAVKGNGFFLVNQAGDVSLAPTLFTRAGSFVKNADGNLVNAGGFTLMGYSLLPPVSAPVVNGPENLVPVNITQLELVANPSTAGTLIVNLNSSAAVVAPPTPINNVAASAWTSKTSMVAYDNLGNNVTLDIYMTKTSGAIPYTWEVTVFNDADAAAGVTPFPYSSAALASINLQFDATGQITAPIPPTLTFTVPNGAAFTLDMTKSTQLAAPFEVRAASVNGNAPADVDHIEISEDGILEAVYQNGARVQTYQIPLATVVSPNNLTPLSGNVYATNIDSGNMEIGNPGTSQYGLIESSQLEQSNVDIATELAIMIESQRIYEANSKVFATGSTLTEVLVNLVR